MSHREFRTGDNDIDNLIWRLEKLEEKAKDCENFPLIKATGHGKEKIAKIKKKIPFRKKKLVRLKEEMDSMKKDLTKMGCEP